MGFAAIVRGFRVPITALDCFLKANGLMPTFGGHPYRSQIDGLRFSSSTVCTLLAQATKNKRTT